MRKIFLIIMILIFIMNPLYTAAQENDLITAKYIILFIGDGCGANQLQAANIYTGTVPVYQLWTNYWISTYSYGGNYNTTSAWSTFDYVKSGATDSAAAATAIYTGIKTSNGRISVSSNATSRLTTIAEEAHVSGRAVGAVTTVQISHATPAALHAHNSNRDNGYAIADEALWGNPNTTGTISEQYYGGSFGNTHPPIDVIIGAGHPAWGGTNYINMEQRDKLVDESGQSGAFTFVERIASSPDGGARLISIANDPQTSRLSGLFGGTSGIFEYSLADGSGRNLENPTLAEATQAAIKVLERNENGFFLLVEGGSIDKAAHSNNMNQMLGEVIDFNQAIAEAISWVENPANDSDWLNTLIIITADHETGYLTAGVGKFPHQSIGNISDYTLPLEKKYDTANNLRASWIDADLDNLIDETETIYWVWNSNSHTNSLVRMFVKGVGEAEFFRLAINWDNNRGYYLDNTDIYTVMELALLGVTPRVLQSYHLPLIIQ